MASGVTVSKTGGQLVNVGDTFVITLTGIENIATLQLTGTWAGAQIAFDASDDGTNFDLGIQGVTRLLDNSLQGGTITLADSTNVSFNVPTPNRKSVQVRLVAKASGTLTCRWDAGSFPSGPSSQPLPVQESALETVTGTVADAPATFTDNPIAGTIIAQLKAMNKAINLQNEIFRDWKVAELKILRSVQRLLSSQVGAYMPFGGDETDGDDGGGGSSM